MQAEESSGPIPDNAVQIHHSAVAQNAAQLTDVE